MSEHRIGDTDRPHHALAAGPSAGRTHVKLLALISVIVVLLAGAATGVAYAAGGSPTAPVADATADPNPDCSIIVPANPLSARGLATPYQLLATNRRKGACHEADTDQSAFVQATIVDTATGAVSVYSPLVVDAGTSPKLAPVVPKLPRHAVVGIWFGYNGDNLTLVGAGSHALRQRARALAVLAVRLLQRTRLLRGRQRRHRGRQAQGAGASDRQRRPAVPDRARLRGSRSRPERQRDEYVSGGGARPHRAEHGGEPARSRHRGHRADERERQRAARRVHRSGARLHPVHRARPGRSGFRRYLARSQRTRRGRHPTEPGGTGADERSDDPGRHRDQCVQGEPLPARGGPAGAAGAR